MSENYTKLAQDIVYSSLWSADGDTCKLWITLLALKDKNGVVSQNISGIQRITQIPIEKCRQAIEFFLSPDPMSSSKELDGRRLEVLSDGGWRVVAHEKYQEYGWSEDKKRFEREKKAKQRENKRIREGKPHPVQKTESPKPDNPHKQDAIKIIALLNEKSGRDFRNSDCSLTPVMARLAESDVTVDGVMKMVERQVKLWKGDGKMEEYLRPGTLFGKEKFNAYYAARELPISKGNHNGNPQRVDRSIGTANEGTASQYKGLGKVS